MQEVDEPDKMEMNRLLLRLMRGINGQAFRGLGNKVLTGPFKGMIIPELTPWEDGNSGTKLLGCYEHELHSAVEEAIARKPEIIINIGCGDGYYAVGMARRCPDNLIIACDTSDQSLIVAQDYATQNGVLNDMKFGNGCYSPYELRFPLFPEGKRLYIVDCEGAEEALLDTVLCSELIKSDIIIECHEFLQEGITQRLKKRFITTHFITEIKPSLPDFNQFPFLKESPSVMAVLLAVEKRPMPTKWLACWALH